MWGATVCGPRTGAWRDAHAQCPYPTLMWGEPPSYYYEYRCDRPRTEMRRLSFRTTPKALEAATKARYPRMDVIWLVRQSTNASWHVQGVTCMQDNVFGRM